MKFKTQEEADEYFFKEYGMSSDDMDAEQAKIDRWIEDNNIIIEENEYSPPKTDEEIKFNNDALLHKTGAYKNKDELEI